MGIIVTCTQCGSTDFDVRDFESMMVISDHLALFGLSCPQCGSRVSAVCAIPPDMHELVRSAASEVGAGMGREASADY